MFCRPRHRLTTSLCMVFALLFSQLALAGYVCPAEAEASAVAAMMASGEPCGEMDQSQPALCHQHATGAAQTFEAVKLPAATMPAIVQVLLVPMVLEAAETVAVPVAATAEAQPPPDPTFFSTLRLRV